MRADIVYYAFGGGAGHVTRSIAVLRRLPPSVSAAAITQSPFSWLYDEAGLPCRVLPSAEREPKKLAARLRDELHALGARVFVVDALPRGLFGEMPFLLPAFDGAKVFVGRYLKPTYLDAYDVPAFVDAQYDAAILAEPWPEERCRALRLPVLETPPILIRDAEEILPRESARPAFQPEGDRPIVLFVSTRFDDEHAGPLLGVLRKIQRRRRTPDFTIRRAALDADDEQAVRLFPLMPWLLGADLVVGASGYNLFYECQALQMEAIFLPKGRLYDDQYWRAEQATWAEEPEHLEALLCDRLRSLTPRDTPPPYPNGARAAAERLLELL